MFAYFTWHFFWSCLQDEFSGWISAYSGTVWVNSPWLTSQLLMFSFSELIFHVLLEGEFKEKEKPHLLTKAESWLCFWNKILHCLLYFLDFPVPGLPSKVDWAMLRIQVPPQNRMELYGFIRVRLFACFTSFIPSKQLFLLFRLMGWLGRDRPAIHSLFSFALSPKLQMLKILSSCNISERWVEGRLHAHLSQISLEPSAFFLHFTLTNQKL